MKHRPSFRIRPLGNTLSVPGWGKLFAAAYLVPTQYAGLVMQHHGYTEAVFVLSKLEPWRLGMWSDLLIAFLIFLPALILGAVEWLTHLQ
jgi:hypothetical protein